MILPADGVAPESLLRAFEGEPRGFWGREGEGWIAHAGVLGEIRMDAPPTPGETRFEAVARVAGDVIGSFAWPTVAEGAEARFYGGFSFLDEPAADPGWSAFPVTRFLLPRVELVHRAAGTILRLREEAHEGERVEDTGIRAGERARALLARLRALDSGASAGAAPNPGAPALPEGGRVLHGGDAEAGPFESAVSDALGQIAGGSVEKVVLARVHDLECPEPIDPVDLLARLRGANPRSHVFLFEPDPGRVLFGAAPETVATLRNRIFRATAVAGSVRRGSTPAEDRMLGTSLLSSPKDRAEHAVTVREIVAGLEGRIIGAVRTDPEPHLLVLSRIQHLETRVEARVSSSETVLSLLQALHPTPAVCGFPRERAFPLLADLEPFERGWYAGPVGWFDIEGEGVFVPALRSAVGGGRRWRAFAGAGIVQGSEPASEWAETTVKLQAALEALSGGALR